MPTQRRSIDGISKPVDTEGPKNSVQLSSLARKNIKSASKKIQIALSVKTIKISLLALVILVSFIVFMSTKNESPVPQDIKNSAGFSIYYPASLPDKFTLDKDSFSLKEGVVSFSVTHDGGKKIAFTEQAFSPTFDFDKFYQKYLIQPAHLSTPLGVAVSGQSNNRQVVSLTTGDTWILMTSDTSVSRLEIKTILNNLKVAK